MTLKRLALAAAVLWSPLVLAGQESPAPPAGPLRVHLESSVLKLGDWAKMIAFAVPSDPVASQVAVAVERKEGAAWVVRFTGRGEFEGQNDVFSCPAAAGGSEAEAQAAVLQAVKLGLMRYVSKSPLSGRVSISLLDQVKPTAVADPWNFWVFSLGVNSFLNGDKTYKRQSWMGNFSAGRVTPDWKVRLSLNGHSNRDEFSFGDYVYKSTAHSAGFSGMAVKSLTDHWSVGGSVTVNSTTRQNVRLSLNPSAAVEYDIFPYSESTKRQLRILYRVGLTNVRYREETIFDKTRETLWSESLSATLELKKPWGTISATLRGQHYFHDLSKNQLEVNGEISFRVFRGLNFNIDGGGSRVHDQLYLAKRGATLEEVLLQRRQLATTYEYFFSVGFSFSFGSISSNIVNPRFGTGGPTSISIRM
jgi:hypothetical protein